MLKCPNCGADVEAGADICLECGNPLVEGKPWDKKDKKEKRKSEERPENAPAPGEVKVKHQTTRRALTQYDRATAVMQEEYYLDKEFVVKEGYCGYDTFTAAEPGEKEPKLREGTVVLTKRAVIFGPSGHAIRCGKFVYEIPVELIEYVTDTTYTNKPALLIRTKDGEDFKMFVLKREEWIKSFEYVTTYRPGEEIATDAGEGVVTAVDDGKPSFFDRWLKPILYMIAAVGCFLFAFFRGEEVNVLFIIFGAIFVVFTIIAIKSPGKIGWF